MKILCADGQVWEVPANFASASPVLRDFAAETFFRASLSLSAYAHAYEAFVSGRELPPPGTDFDDILNAIAACDELKVPIPLTLYAFNMLLVLETIRSSGVANPYDASTCVLISYQLEQVFPQVFRSLRNQADFEMFYWRLVRRGQDPEKMLFEIIGEDPLVRRASMMLRNKLI